MFHSFFIRTSTVRPPVFLRKLQTLKHADIVELCAEHRQIMRNNFEGYALLTARVICNVNFTFCNHTAGSS